VARIARGHGTTTVAGGPDSTTRPEVYLSGGFDAVAIGEGEATIVELARTVAAGEPFAGLAGIAVAGPGGVVRGPARSFLRPLDSLPMPAWDLIDMEAYLGRWERRTGERRMAVLTSRGCPFDCSWCSKPTFGRTFRQLSAARVVKELRLLRSRYRVDYVRFCDDVFGIDRAWTDGLLSTMEAEPLGIKFECLARVDLLKPDLLQRMRALGLQRVYVGVESGSQKMLDLMNRGTTLAQVERTARSLRENGVRQYWFLMLGYPGETLEDIERTLGLFRRFSPEEYSVSIAVPIPGTRFHEQVRDRLRPADPTRGAGGRALLFEGAYPEALYHWEQARFRFAAELAKVRGKISPKVVEALEHASDSLVHRLVDPILLGGSAPVAEPTPAHGHPSSDVIMG
jgi:anaerobic magnesium-protoporphyrin IX monomethyl ester cyclase